jgi:glucose-1-phosphatase
VGKIQAIIFDIGRVLVRLDIAGAMSGLSSDVKLSPQETWSAIEHDPRWIDWQEGRMQPRDWYLHISRRLGVKLPYEEFVEVWNKVLDPTPMLENSFLEDLSRHYKLALLSNTDPIHVAALEKQYDWYKFFQPTRRIYSCVVAASKPSPIIFRAALQACKVKAENALFIDDVEKHVRAAEQLGMTGLVFQSAEQLLADFEDFGLVPRPTA